MENIKPLTPGMTASKQLRALEVGETIAFDIKRTPYIRLIASQISLINSIKLKTYTDRETGKIYVTRLNRLNKEI